jgi:UDP-GlcNAc:undecaprenyl-phosphate GlcNAc-1-phosphate transferase
MTDPAPQTALVLCLALMGAAIAWAVGHHAGRLGARLGLLDFPDPAGGRKLHAAVTPLVGGLAVVATAVLASLALLLMLDWPEARLEIAWFGIVTLGMFLIGAADDRFGLSAPFRLGIATALLLLALARVPGFQVDFLLFAGQDRLVLLSGLMGLGFTLLCLVGFLNAVNMADGKNGLVIGQALIWSVVLAFRLPPHLLPLVAALGAALAVLFLYNMRGALFLGDGGSYALSASFGLLAILAWNKGFADMRADDVALIFAIPVFDTLRLIAQRVAQGKTPFTPGRDHLHHYLHAHWGWPRPLPWVLAIVAVPNALALLFPGTGLLWLGVTLVLYILLLAIAIRPAPAPEPAE